MDGTTATAAAVSFSDKLNEVPFQRRQSGVLAVSKDVEVLSVKGAADEFLGHDQQVIDTQTQVVA